MAKIQTSKVSEDQPETQDSIQLEMAVEAYKIYESKTHQLIQEEPNVPPLEGTAKVKLSFQNQRRELDLNR